MSNLHRKTLRITIRDLCKPNDACDDRYLPPPQQNHPVTPFKVLTICALVATFVFVFYIVIIKICRVFQSRWLRRRINSNRNANETHQDFLHEDHEPVVFHPIWLINTVGLDQAVINSIEIFNYRKEEGLIDSDCPVCLGVFQENEHLRLLPKCSHAFHVDCIDPWLRSHKNCPLCRAPVVSTGQTDRNLVESSTQEEVPFGVGAENIQEIDLNGWVRLQSDFDLTSQKVEPMRRSVSMGSFCFVDPSEECGRSGLIATIHGRGMKSSSFGPRTELQEI